MSDHTPITPAPVQPATPDTGIHTSAAPTAADHSRVHRLEGPAAAVGAVAAAILLATAGALQILQGISAVEADDIIVVGPQYTYQWNTTGWGVVHIIIGALLVAVAAALFTGRTWARATAITLAALSIVANFLWLPYNPWWSILIIALTPSSSGLWPPGTTTPATRNRGPYFGEHLPNWENEPVEVRPPTLGGRIALCGNPLGWSRRHHLSISERPRVVCRVTVADLPSAVPRPVVSVP
ncbi:DUF7144 family membrane protein [Nocardia africana]|uniref:DUF7144 domain-containing protein n=1 Tax=Nocardia africana TaxID=134964 RepID=A0A378WU64_9NOCA|nr:hypothetical protein [Nocardia africana]SUA44758.1 Uncharacterised protein [Nocardia africana]